MHALRSFPAFALSSLLPLLALSAAVSVAPEAQAQESQLDALKSAAHANVNDPSAALAFGRGLRRAGHATEAIAELRRGLNLWNARSGDVAASLHMELARTQIARKDFGQAMVQCRVLGALTGPGSAALGHTCAAEAHLLWRRASEALTETTLALAGGAKNYDAKVDEGLAREFELKDAEAEASYREAIGWKSDRADAHTVLGRLLMRTARGEPALVELRRGAELDPTGPEALFELAVALPANAEAVGFLQRAVHERPGYGDALRKLADVQLYLGKLPEAKKAAEAALTVDAQDSGTHVIYGRVLLAEGKPDDAIRAGQSALKILANSAKAKLLIADANAKKGEIDLAVESYQGAYGLDHGDPAALVRASEACHAAGRNTSAKAFGMKATTEFPQWGPAWAAYGDALAADHEDAQARVAYESALKGKGPIDAGALRRKMAALK